METICFAFNFAQAITEKIIILYTVIGPLRTRKMYKAKKLKRHLEREKPFEVANPRRSKWPKIFENLKK